MDETRKKIEIGGLMRCCISTLTENTEPEEEGTVLPCAHCSSSMIVREGIWRWNQPTKNDTEGDFQQGVDFD